MSEQSAEIMADWTSSDLRCVVLVGPTGALNGYVGLPSGHPLHSKPYSEPQPFLAAMWERRKMQPIGDPPPFSILIAALGGFKEEDGLRPEMCLDVHGGVTYTGSDIRGLDSSLWWYGFDTAHAGDYSPRYPNGGTVRTLEYVRAEAEKLAAQLAQIGWDCKVKEAAQ